MPDADDVLSEAEAPVADEAGVRAPGPVLGQPLRGGGLDALQVALLEDVDGGELREGFGPLVALGGGALLDLWKDRR